MNQEEQTSLIFNTIKLLSSFMKEESIKIKIIFKLSEIVL